ncbi:thiamine-phosphate pyrophosphorylase [Rhodococcus sp. LBL1]|uniref:Thiamine-phosphate synthase n=1 Tax=Prescottella agglutinans TaxID=1644129 RepID=A0ABT6M4Z5_9NOCA|nr:thiamine phosphate synthase [Prescottella agglutinans]MDH6278826.1 thiamine-phosphate pyrophosphorylase [Prescottella agglutinans]MDH6680514.1 thiamine-phosphate pyrophosphorylase [Rhodococcus sp. LBL1]MDH6685943.1 thiamine-phosphate pyrophosphorylase [Rhodococcus sp. LBL2]
MHASQSVKHLTPRERLADARLYLCTDARRDKGDLAHFVEAALAGGVDIVQLRDKGSAGEREFGPLEVKEELAALAVLGAAARRHGALLAVNDRADLALAAGADVLHLGQNDLPVHYARRIVGPDVVIGRSTNNRAQASLAAIEEDVDYFCTGPVWATPTKPGRTASGLELVRSTAEAAPPRPWFAIGGVDQERLPQILEAGATRVVVVRAITDADDPEAAARALSDALRG